MTIWFDLGHIPQYNFCSAMIRQFAEKGYIVYVTVLKRGRLLSIVQSELAIYPNVHVVQIGEHGMNLFSAIWNANIKRIWRMLWWAQGKHIDCAISSTLPCAIVARLIRARMYAYTDDTQRGTYKWIVRFCTSETNLLVPAVGKLAEKKTTVLNALKEWAYLAPNVFTPNPKALEKYGVRPKEYIFLREVSVGTVNYAGQAPQAILAVKDLINSLCQSPSAGANVASSNTGANTAFYADSGESLQFCATGGEQFCNLDGKAPSGDVALTEKAGVELAQKADLADNAKASIGDAASGQIFSSKPCASAQSALSADHPFKVLFSLEEKNRRGEYPEDWILLQEPIEGIHSLMYYSAGLVSSGDSMAREAALLGIPAYYLGTRHSMPANLAAAKVAGLQNELTMPFSDWLNTLHGTPDELQQKQDTLRRKIDADFIDINAYMMGLVEKSEWKIEERK